MLEKGPIGLMVPVLALGSQVLYTRNFRVILRWQWFAGLVVIAIMLAPMVYGLYAQFGAEGLEFYFWTQSFGRITGQSEWKDSSTVFYFVHTFLWAFLPWMLLAYFGIFRQLVELIKLRLRVTGNFEVITLAGFILTFIAMSLSNYKLPHYIFVVFPLAAIITAKTIWDLLDNARARRFFRFAQPIIALLLFVAVGLLTFISFSPAPWLIIALLFIGIGVTLSLVVYNSSGYKQIVLVSLAAAITVNVMLAGFVYPTLLQYQAGSVAGKQLKAADSQLDLYSYMVVSDALDFYSGAYVPLLNDNTVRESYGALIFTKPKGLEKLNEMGLEYEILNTYDYFHVTELTAEFLNPATRHKAASERYLIQLIEPK
jgi:4-amino-4-deoxy-L-arabinose transferase-like glycosyltransferase